MCTSIKIIQNRSTVVRYLAVSTRKDDVVQLPVHFLLEMLVALELNEAASGLRHLQ